MSTTFYPIPPHVCFRVGVTGHRGPPKLPAESEAPVRAALDRILAVIVDEGRKAENAYMACAPARDASAGGSGAAASGATKPAGTGGDFVVISSLAEGADRLVAEAALAAGFALEAVLPFSRAEYGRDFKTQDSRAAYDGLLQRAAAVFELDGRLDESPRAYETAGFIMLANTDLLVVIWDGNLAAGIGGTAQIISRAIADGIPIVWIEPTSPNAMHLSWPSKGEVRAANAYTRPKETFRSTNESELAAAIRDILSLPTQPDALNTLQRYLRTKEPRWNFCPWFPMLLWVFGVRSPRLNDFHLSPALADMKAQWQRYLTVLPKDRAQRPAIENILLPACSAADHLAAYYSLVYRSTYVFNFLFAAIAVAIALNGIFIHEPTTKSYLVIGELAIIVAILITWMRGRRLLWHRHWLDYRRLAECLRHMRIFAPMGAEGSANRPGRGLDLEEQDWIDWYAWSLRRLLPLPDCAVDDNYLEAMRDTVRSTEIEGQIGYHNAIADRMTKLDHRIHRTGEILFATTACLCIGFVGLAWFGAFDRIDHAARDAILGGITFLTALLPTLGAALGAINGHGDFKTVAAQSRRTAQRLAAIDRILADEEPAFARLADRIEKTSEVMMSDLLEWQTVFRTRPLALPA